MKTLLSILLLGFAVRTPAAVFQVTNTNNSGAGSLRQAVTDSNNAAGADEITFNTAGTFSIPRTITLNTPLDIRGNLTITGPVNAAQQVTIHGAAAGTRLMTITVSGLTLNMTDLIWENGKASAALDEGAILNASAEGTVLTLSVQRCTFKDSTAQYAGAVFSIFSGVLNFTDCNFRNNTTIGATVLDMTNPDSFGTNAGGWVTMTNCDFSNNTSTGAGFGGHGDVIMQEVGDLTMTNCTIQDTTGNNDVISLSQGGVAGRLTMTDCVLEDNPGGGVNVFDKDVILSGCRFERCGSVVKSAAYYSDGNFTMTDCVCLDNDSMIYWATDMTVEDSRFENNRGEMRANSGVVGYEGLSTFRRVKFRSNQAAVEMDLLAEDCDFDSNTNFGLGGPDATNVTLRRTAVTRNTGAFNAVAAGGTLVGTEFAQLIAETVLVESCTFSDNSGLIQPLRVGKFLNATFYGNINTRPGTNSDGMLIYAGPNPPSGTEIPLTLQNCVFASNATGTKLLLRTRAASSGGTQIKSMGGNFIDRTDFLSFGTGGTNNTDQISTPPGNTVLDPLLGPLADWGGPGLSRMPLTNSPLIEAGNLAPSSPDYQSPFKDQSGKTRLTGTKVDIGALEARSRLTVTNTNDSGAGSLRDAVAQLSTLANAEIIFSDNVFGTTAQTVTLTSGQIVLTTGITITGPDVGVAISGNSTNRIFSITGTNGTYAMEHINFHHGNSTNDGGAINLSAGANSKLTLRDCVFNLNNATGLGGGLFVTDGTVVATNCLWSSNTANNNGGGICASSGATLKLTNCTLSSNSSNQAGGGLQNNSSTTTLIHCTVKGNTADADTNNAANNNGGGIRVTGSPALQLGNTVVAENTDASAGGSATIHPDVSGPFTTLGHNFVGKTDGQTSGVANGVSGDLAGTIASPIVPQLAALADNGGLFKTHKPQTGSPLINAGDAALLTNAAWPETPLYDSRVQFRNLNGAPDIGAVEAPDGVYLRLLRDVDTIASEHPDEGSANYILQRSRPGAEVVVNLGRSLASTAAAADVELSSPKLSVFASGLWNLTIGTNVLTKQISVVAVNDSIAEAPESFILALVISANYTIDSTTATDRTVTILSNDAVVTTTANSGAGSLRDAVSSLSSLASGEIYFDSTVFNVARTIALSTPITLRGVSLMIKGPASPLTIDGANTSELFAIQGNVTLRDLNLTRGFGRAIIAPDIGSTAIDIPSSSTLTLNRCCLYNCLGNYYGGAVSVQAYGRLVGINTTFSGNTTTGNGGAVYVWYDGTADLTHCTLAFNRADSMATASGKGGAIYLSDSMPGNPYSAKARLTVRGCLFSQNIDQTSYVETNWNTRSSSIETAGGTGSFSSEGWNYFSTYRHSGVAHAHDYKTDSQVVQAAWTPNFVMLSPLANHGGPTLTHTLAGESIAADLVTQTFSTEDQRAQPRTAPSAAGSLALGVESYNYWKSYSFPAGASLTNPLDDFDRDGVTNLVEQYTGTNPASGSSIPQVTFFIDPTVGRRLNITYPVSSTVDQSRITVQQSTNLQTWTALTSYTFTTYTNVGAQQYKSFVAAETSNSGTTVPRRFVRLNVTSP